MTLLETCGAWIGPITNGCIEGEHGKICWSEINDGKTVLLCFAATDDVEPGGSLFNPWIKKTGRSCFLSELSEITKILNADFLKAAAISQGISPDEVENREDFLLHYGHQP